MQQFLSKDSKNNVTKKERIMKVKSQAWLNLLLHSLSFTETTSSRIRGISTFHPIKSLYAYYKLDVFVVCVRNNLSLFSSSSSLFSSHLICGRSKPSHLISTTFLFFSHHALLPHPRTQVKDSLSHKYLTEGSPRSLWKLFSRTMRGLIEV